MNDQKFNRRFQLMREHEAKLMKEYGYVVHYVFETDKREFNGMINAHTEGVQENFGHLDLQIVLPLSQETVHPVIAGMVHRIKTEGVVFEPETKNSEVLEGYDVYLKVFRHDGKDFLRVILPDKEGRFPFDEGCEPIYKQQMEELGMNLTMIQPESKESTMDVETYELQFLSDQMEIRPMVENWVKDAHESCTEDGTLTPTLGDVYSFCRTTILPFALMERAMIFNDVDLDGPDSDIDFDGPTDGSLKDYIIAQSKEGVTGDEILNEILDLILTTMPLEYEENAFSSAFSRDIEYFLRKQHLEFINSKESTKYE